MIVISRRGWGCVEQQQDIKDYHLGRADNKMAALMSTNHARQTGQRSGSVRGISAAKARPSQSVHHCSADNASLLERKADKLGNGAGCSHLLFDDMEAI